MAVKVSIAYIKPLGFKGVLLYLGKAREFQRKQSFHLFAAATEVVVCV